MKVEITTVWHVTVFPEHYCEGAGDEGIVKGEIDSLESALRYGNPFDWASIVSATGRVIEE